MKDYIDYSDEVLFKLGQRVHLDLPDIPKEQRDVTTGIIVKMDTHFPGSPEHRKIRVTIRIDRKGNYIKKEFRFAGGISHDFTCGQDTLAPKP
ncbi:hypothetical protein LCGC14_2115010 [marine sediment metagenome]|uniref:Uncharacterized protein n=1 Tax=marine sediment metagenome TaxID=412755 RepID=A0A0F9GJ13_9ZZZZ